MLEPDGTPAGAVVFLHGLTDSPYSLRHIARRYREHGYVSIAIRLPAHGTVPGALTGVEWQDWMAATRLAVREARRRIGPSLPLHMIGFSNGGALALKYALDALEDPRLTRPDRLVLIAPMIGITRFARFVGLAGLPALLPAFAKAAWLSVVPEFNPFKYNSFPVNGGTANLSPERRAAAADHAPCPRETLGSPGAAPDLSIRHRLYRQHAGNCFGLVCPTSIKWQRTRAVRPEPERQVRPTAADRLGHRFGASSAAAAAAVQSNDHHQCKPRQQ